MNNFFKYFIIIIIAFFTLKILENHINELYLYAQDNSVKEKLKITKQSSFLKAKELFILEEYQKSIHILEKIIEKEGRKSDTLYLLALNYFKLSNFKEAKKIFLELIEIDPLINFAKKEEFYKKLSRIDDWVQSEKILKEVELKKEFQKTIYNVIKILFIFIFIFFILFMMQDHIKRVFSKKEEKNNINLNSHFENCFNEIRNHIKYMAKVKDNPEDYNFDEAMQNKLKKDLEYFIQKKTNLDLEYEYLQLNYDFSDIAKNNHFFKKLESTRKEVKKLREHLNSYEKRNY